MVYDASSVPTDTATLQALVINPSQTIDKLTQEIRRLTTLIEKFFGKSSEKLPKETPSEESVSVPAVRKKRVKNGGGGRSALPAGPPRVEKVVDVPEEECRCDCCEQLFKCIGEERSGMD
jgi:hypothetical protein